ncbi:thiopeptide-type bacteriocin biosynthesis protein [Chryseobacterium wangxinyae]|uniref:thiopeptide-type bacteriocin biosynthesis protein n=1 Tax=Chryseobacterium sp. CY353 TaxID=2997334 RepID=UPI00226E7C92|nr:thiopeptide-type bacteriocin biosynthesis protein [Chryseobacterium sp. CY353]MCY0970812.1 thiopeptide-type bacteriocin biosynthesis protein [Chryseobacterium sp. CY353]
MTNRIFTIGSEWLYIKLYTSPFLGDKILLRIYPHIDKLIYTKIIEKFFFVRYNDPDFHIRIRIKLFDRNKFSNIINDIHSILDIYLQSNTVEVKLEGYKRELERYNPQLIDDIESLFFHNSLSTLNLIRSIENNILDDTDRWLFGLFYIDNILSLFDMSIEKKIEFVKLNNDSYSIEFNKNKLLNKQLDKKYRDNRKTIDDIFLNRTYKDIVNYSALTHIIKDINNKKKINTILHFNHILSSIIHMNCNRLFKDDQRKHEYLLYDFIYRYYKSILFKKETK